MIQLPGYITLDPIYESGHSLIYRGRCTADDLPVIIKLLKAAYPTPEELARFRREYEITHKLQSEGIIHAYALESYQHSLVMVLEDFGGESLTRLLSERTLEFEECLRLAIRIAEILGQIHHQHIMHKDINPSNIVWNSETAQVKLIDFGISTELSREQPEVRNPNVLEGTLAYMSPEQTGRMNRAMDYRTDLYSLGATLYHLLTGHLPFDPTDPMELVHCHLAKLPVPPSDLMDNSPFPIPHAQLSLLSGIILKLLAKNAEDRYQSAYGVKADLEACVANLRGLQDLEGFTLAQHDLSERFQIPQKLYGRAQEIETLLTAFERVSHGATELMLVTGYAGIGKSALVNEIHKPIVAKRGYFIAGKFDQFKRNIPYSAMIQAFQGLMRHLLSESDTQIAVWKENLLQAVGSNGQIIIDVIPEIELIIGAQPAVPELPPAQAQNRFNLVFQNFVRTFAAAEHPLVIFLDDLQWADMPSLNLLEVLITDPTTQFILIIGAYRDNEVHAAHPLMRMLEDLRKTETPVKTITLTPLHQEHVQVLITDTLHCAPEQAHPLTAIVLEKTGGNPLFVTQLLLTLYEDGLVTFDRTLGGWTWDLDVLNQMEMTENVVELMAGKMQKLPEQTQQVMKLAACIGNQFDLEMLAIMYETTPQQTLHDLWNAMQEGLIVPLDDTYKYIEMIVPGDASSTQHPASSFKFLHDRVQQAAYSLIDEAQKQHVHLNIGRLLLAHTPETEREDNIFDVVNHLNIGSTLLSNQTEKNELAELNLIAGKKAKASAAFHPACEYLQTGIALLGDESWQQTYGLALALHTQGAETAYLTGAFDQMEDLAQIVLEHASSLLDTVNVCVIKIEAYKAQNKALDAVKIGIQVLKGLGITFPKRPRRWHVWFGLLRTRLALVGTRIEDVADLPNMTDVSMLAAVQILSNLTHAAQNIAPQLYPLMSLKLLRLSLTYGSTAASASAFAEYGKFLCSIKKDFENGCRFGQVALHILERINTKDVLTMVWIHLYLTHWKDHCRHALPALLDAYHIGMETGDFVYASGAQSTYAQHACFIGEELTRLEHELLTLREGLRQMKNERFLLMNAMHRQFVLNLMDPSETATDTSPDTLGGSSYHEDKLLPVHQHANDSSAICLLYCYKLILATFFQVYPEAVEYATIAEPLLTPGSSSLTAAMITFYGTLARLGAYATASKTEQRRFSKKIKANQKKMKIWAKHAPMNFLHKWYLVEAERMRILGQDTHAMEYYDNAIAGAKEHEYIHEEALANELAARFWLEKGKDEYARSHLLKARYCYQQWGAKRKVQDVEEQYPHLLLKPRAETGTTTTAPPTGTTGTRSEALDLSTVMKASQAISGEIVLDNLTARLIRIAIENAGAQRGLLLLKQGNTFVIAAEDAVASANAFATTPTHHLPIEQRADLSLAIINYVARTQEAVVLHDAAQDGDFTIDPYIVTHQPKSLLCTPILQQGKLTGMLYLENNLTTGAFTADRLQVLQVLASQAAISLENAHLYANLEEKVKERTRQLEDAHQEIVRLEKAALEVKMAGGFAHEMRNALVGAVAVMETVMEDDQTLCEQNAARLGALFQTIEPHIPKETQADVLDQLKTLDRNEETLHHILDMVSGYIRRAMRVTTLILDYARLGGPEAGEQEVHLTQIIQTIVQEQQPVLQEQQIRLQTTLPDLQQLTPLRGHPEHFHTIFNNLVLNARDALLEVRDERERLIEITVTEDTGCHTITVRDTADGIPDTQLAKIFDPFFSTKPSAGIGLGLSLTRKLMQLYQGTIDVQSDVGKGTTFTLAFPK